MMSNNQSEDEVPYCRLFVSCPTYYTKEFLHQQFSAFGNVQTIKMISDKVTREFKGVAFVKFDRASSAAFALENLDGVQLDSEGMIRVSYAAPRGSPKSVVDDSEQPPRSRLFITFLKTLEVDELQQRFAQFGDLEYVKLLSGPRTSGNRGIAYAKYSKTSSAMRALEEISEEEALCPSAVQPMRVKIADPNQVQGGRGSNQHMPSAPIHNYQMQAMHQMQMHNRHSKPSSSYHQDQAPSQGGGLAMWKNPMLASQRIDNNNPCGSRVWFSVSKKLPVAYLQKLFGRYGFLESIYFMQGSNCGYAKYNSAAAAATAVNALNMMEVSGDVVAKVCIATPQMEGMNNNTQFMKRNGRQK